MAGNGVTERIEKLDTQFLDSIVSSFGGSLAQLKLKEWAMRNTIVWQNFGTIPKSGCSTKHLKYQNYACAAEVPRKRQQWTAVSLLFELVSIA